MNFWLGCLIGLALAFFAVLLGSGCLSPGPVVFIIAAAAFAMGNVWRNP